MLHHGIGNFFFLGHQIGTLDEPSEGSGGLETSKNASKAILHYAPAPTEDFGGFGECWKRSGVLLSIPYKTGQCLSKYMRF